MNFFLIIRGIFISIAMILVLIPVITFLKTGSKKILKSKMYISAVIIIIVCIGTSDRLNTWYTSPIPGYTEQFIESNGGYYTRQDIFILKHFFLYPNAGGTIGTGIGGSPTQQDLDLQIEIANELNHSRDVSGFGIGSEDAVNPSLDYSELDEEINIGIDYLSKDGKGPLYIEEEKMKETEVYVKLFSNRESVQIWNSGFGYLTFEGTKNIKELDLASGWNLSEISKIDFEGIENVEKINFSEYINDEDLQYLYYPKYRLEEFLHDWGWLDEDGYYGKVYEKPKETELYKKGIYMCGSVECDTKTNGDRGIPPEEYKEEE